MGNLFFHVSRHFTLLLPQLPIMSLFYTFFVDGMGAGEKIKEALWNQMYLEALSGR